MPLEGGELLELAEAVPGGPSVRELESIARDAGVHVAAGLIERDGDRLFNTYAVVGPEGLVARFRKIHPFINPSLSAGDSYQVFEALGTKWGILICYDNNLPENVRVTALLGAEVILMPHVTCGL